VLVLSLFVFKIPHHALSVIHQIIHVHQHLLVLALDRLKLFFKELIMALMQLIKNLHLERSQRLSPNPELPLNMCFELLLLLTVSGGELPVVLRFA
jgi:hypothetical protein